MLKDMSGKHPSDVFAEEMFSTLKRQAEAKRAQLARAAFAEGKTIPEIAHEIRMVEKAGRQTLRKEEEEK